MVLKVEFFMVLLFLRVFVLRDLGFRVLMIRF
jgi:hypothetical protein